MNNHTFQTTQFIPATISHVFDFFSQPTNLERLTPPWLHFHITKISTPHIQEGTVIDYKLKLHGIPFAWQSLIKEWTPQQRFIDVQTKGPYALWHHTHEFVAVDGGTNIIDNVIYRLPCSILTDLIAGSFVHKDITRIFAYRQAQIQQIFG